MKSTKRIFASLLTVLSLASATLASHAAEPPKVGEAATDFTLKTLDGKSVTLSAETAKSPVVLIVLRGWPGYQCPLCTRQIHEFVLVADALNAKARVLMVYPGPAADLKAHAEEFLKNKDWPEKFLFVTDPDYTFTKSYGLRWDAPGETAYPSTFVIDAKGKIQSAKISKGHGGRATAAEVLKTLAEIK